MADTAAQPFHIEPTPGGVGAFVHGIDLANDLNGNTVGVLRQALGDHCVLFFRDQKLTPDEHIAAAEAFGEINVNRFFARLPTHDKIALVVKEPDQSANIGGNWHTDHSYDQIPAMGSMLLARETPTRGGDTLFANMYAAYDALSDRMKTYLEGLTARHDGEEQYRGRYDANDGDKRYPARRWVVERTLAWLSKCRAVLVRYDKKASNYLGLLQLACALLWFRRQWRLAFLR